MVLVSQLGEGVLSLFLTPSFFVTLGVFRTFSLCAALLHVTELSHGAAESWHIGKYSVMYCHTHIDVHTFTDKFMEVQGACPYSQDVLSVC